MCSGSLLARSTKLIATAQESFAHQQTLLTFTLRYDRKLPGLIRDVNIQVVTLRHPSKGGSVGTSSDDGIRRDPSRLRVVGLKLALCELVS